MTQLCLSDILVIRKSKNRKLLAKEYGRSERQIRRIIRGDSWRYIVGA